jgi:hypothetical protein
MEWQWFSGDNSHQTATRTATKQPLNAPVAVQVREKSAESSGGCFGGCWFPTFLRLAAEHCNVDLVSMMFRINALRDALRRIAKLCKTSKTGLKIRRGQPRGGSPPPPGTKIHGPRFRDPLDST